MMHRRTLSAEFDSLVKCRQISIRPQLLASDRVALGIPQNNVSRQVLVQRAQGVADPGSHNRTSGKNPAGQQHVETFKMIVVLGVHRSHKAQVIDNGADVRQSVGHVHTAVAVSAELQRRRQ